MDDLRSPDPLERLRALWQIIESGSPKTAPMLIEALRDDDHRVIRAAAEALGELKTPEAVPALIEVLRGAAWKEWWDVHVKPASEAQQQAMLGAMMVVLAIRTTRAVAARALGWIGEPGVVDELLAALREEHILAVPKASAEALEQIGTSEALLEVGRWREAHKNETRLPDRRQPR